MYDMKTLPPLVDAKNKGLGLEALIYYCSAAAATTTTTRMYYKEEVKRQMEERRVAKEKEAEEILRLEKEWLQQLEKTDKDRHSAFAKIVAKQVLLSDHYDDD